MDATTRKINLWHWHDLRGGSHMARRPERICELKPHRRLRHIAYYRPTFNGRFTGSTSGIVNFPTVCHWYVCTNGDESCGVYRGRLAVYNPHRSVTFFEVFSCTIQTHKPF